MSKQDLDKIAQREFQASFQALSDWGKETVVAIAKLEGVDVSSIESSITDAVAAQQYQADAIILRERLGKREKELEVALAENRDLWEENEELKIELYNLRGDRD